MTISERVALFLRTRQKPTLPEGYQFGEGAIGYIYGDDVYADALTGQIVRVPHGQTPPAGWNVIEGEQH